jgi:predicted Zn-dependent protease
MLKRLIPFVALLVAACTPATQTPKGNFDNVRVHEEAKVSIKVPQGWVVDDSTPNMLIMHDPAQEVGVFFQVTEAKDGPAAIEEVTNGLFSIITDVQADGELSQTKINGMDAWSMNAKGKSDGKDVDISFGFLMTPSGKMMIILGLAESGKLEAHLGEWTALVDGIRPLE